MRVKNYGDSVEIWVSARDTYEWARRIGAAWPCSELSGKRFYACFDTNGLLELTVNGKQGVDVDHNEFNAITSDFLGEVLTPDDAVYFVTVGQFK